MAREADERELVARLLAELGIRVDSVESLSPPRPDVVAATPGGRIAVEVTELHPDERPDVGSDLRRREEQRQRVPTPVPMSYFVTKDVASAIEQRITDKLRNHYEIELKGSLWLLIVGSVPRPGSIAATFVTFVPNTDDLERFSSVLAQSQFDRVYLYFPLSGRALICWSRDTGWVTVRTQSFDKTGVEALMSLRNASLTR